MLAELPQVHVPVQAEAASA